jgi:hypothetical protein
MIRVFIVALLTTSAIAIGTANCTSYGADCPTCAAFSYSTATVRNAAGSHLSHLSQISIINDSNTAFLTNFKVRLFAFYLPLSVSSML